MKEFLTNFKKKSGLNPIRVWKEKDAYLVQARTEDENEVVMDDMYLTDEKISRILIFTPPMNFELYSKFMKNPVYGG